MTLEELLAHKLTGLRHSQLVVGQADGQIDNASQHPATDTALLVDKWGMRRGEELADARFDSKLMADCHAAMFEPRPELSPNPADKRRGQWFADLLGSDDYKSVHVNTMYDKGLSEISARAIADEWLKYAKDLPPEDKPDESLEADLERVRSVGKALEEAKEDVACAVECARGMGAAPRVDGKLDSADLARAFKAVRDDVDLRRIFEMAGRFRRFASAAQKSKAKHGYDDMVGVKMDGEVPHLVAAELGKLACEEMELDLLRRVVERQALCREYEGQEKVAQGPIVVVVDESGSMCGEKVINAKAVALAMGWVAMHQKRWIAFVGYSGGCGGTRLCMPPGKWDQAKLIEWLQHFFSRGSNLDLPIKELPEVYWKEFNAPKGKTDVLFITDAICSIPPRAKASFLAWKERENVKCYGLVIQSKPGDLAGICDMHWTIDGINLKEDGIKEVLSI